MKQEWIILNNQKTLGLNISAIVGFAGVNLKDDVLLIQGFFNYIAKGFGAAAVGLGGVYKVPEITGEMDADTYSAISEFQIRNAHQLLTGHQFDGRIHPGNFKNRHLSSRGLNRHMFITLLNIMAIDAAVMQGQLDYVQGLAGLKLELGLAIDQAILNS
ncbi:MAG: hypothetical protein ACR2HG_06405 [Pyrinomonadaceae bacterium]